jgi:hypothetical protein
VLRLGKYFNTFEIVKYLSGQNGKAEYREKISREKILGILEINCESQRKTVNS